MKVAIAHLGPVSELVAASSVTKGIKKQSVKTDITWVVADEHTYIFKYNKDVRRILSASEFKRMYRIWFL